MDNITDFRAHSARKSLPTIEVTEGQISSQSPRDATQFTIQIVAFVWQWTEEAINLPLGCLQGGVARSVNNPWRLAGRRTVDGSVWKLTDLYCLETDESLL